MFFIRSQFCEDEIPIYDDEIMARCAECGDEFHVPKELLKFVLEHGDLSDTEVMCTRCSIEYEKKMNEEK